MVVSISDYLVSVGGHGGAGGGSVSGLVSQYQTCTLQLQHHTLYGRKRPFKGAGTFSVRLIQDSLTFFRGPVQQVCFTQVFHRSFTLLTHDHPHTFTTSFNSGLQLRVPLFAFHLLQAVLQSQQQLFHKETRKFPAKTPPPPTKAINSIIIQKIPFTQTPDLLAEKCFLHFSTRFE